MNEKPKYKTLCVMLRVDLIIPAIANPGDIAARILNQTDSGLKALQPYDSWLQRVDIASIATGHPETYEKAKGVHPEL